MKLLRGVGQARAKFTVGTASRFMTFATMKEISLSISAEDTRQTGGDKLFPLDILTHTKSGRIRIVDAQLIMDVFQLMGAGTAATAGNIMVPETLTVSGGAITTTVAYVAGSVSILDEDGNPVWTFTEAGGTSITGLDSSLNTTQVSVLYETAVFTDITKFTLHSDDEPLYFELTHISNFRDPQDNKIKTFQTHIYRCRMLGNIEFGFTHGEFTAPAMEAEVLDPGRSDKAILHYTFGTRPVGLGG